VFRLRLSCALTVLGLACWAAPAGAYVFWSSPLRSTIGRANLNGSGADSTYVTRPPALRPSGIAVGGQYVYWVNADPGSIVRQSLDAIGAPDQTLIGRVPTPEGLAVNGHYIYWADEAAGMIGRAGLDGSHPNERFISGAHHPYGVAVDGQYIYWTNFATGTIGRAAVDGSGVDESFITGADRPYGVAVNGQYIYWTNLRGNTIGRAAVDGSGADESFITGAGGPTGIAVDPGYLYWSSLRTHSVARAPIDGSGSVDDAFIRVTDSQWVAVADRAPTWTLQFTATPASATIGTAVTLSAATNNILRGRPRDEITILEGTTVVKRCRTNSCTVEAGGGLGTTTFEAEVTPVHSKKVLVSAGASVDRTKPTCPGGNTCT